MNMADNDPKAVARERLIRGAWDETPSGSVSPRALHLPELVAAMKQQGKITPDLACLYFAGADVDHPYFLQNTALAFGISVLPENAEKAAKSKRHPHQVEVIFVLDGSLDLHVEGRQGVEIHSLSQGDHYVIGKDVCHWITPQEGRSAVFAFAKTNPALEPRSIDCTIA